MLTALVGAVVLAILLKSLSDAEVGLGGVLLTSVGTSICGSLLAYLMVLYMGVTGAFLALPVIALALAVFLSVFYEIELWRSAVIATGYLIAVATTSWVLTSITQPG